MGSISDDGVSRHLKVLLPSSSQKLRLSGDLARCLDVTTVMLVSPMGSKVWRVEVGRDGNGAFLGRGWPEFVAAHSIKDLWFLVFRHEGAGVLTVKAFDTSCCLREFSRPLNASNWIDTAGRRGRPHFIKVLLRGFTKNMAIPPDFVHRHITDEAEVNSLPTALLSLCGKYWRVKIDRDKSGNVFLSGGGWSRFLASNDIIQGEALVLRYEGNLVFTVKVFGLNGCQKCFRSTKMSDLQQEQGQKMAEEEKGAPSLSICKRKKTNEVPTNAETKRRTRRSTTPSNKISEIAGDSVCTYGKFCTYDIGPPSWIKRAINAYALKQRLRLAPTFCKAIGFLQPCKITLRTTSWTGKGDTSGSWQVRGRVYSKFNDPPSLEKGWTSFCRDNDLKEGDVCTFKIMEPTLWHVDIARSSS